MVDITIDGHRLRARGILDGRAEDAFRGALAKLVASGDRVVDIDLTEVSEIASVCVGALVAAWIDVHAARGVMALRTSPPVRRTLDLIGLTSVLMRNGDSSPRPSGRPGRSRDGKR